MYKISRVSIDLPELKPGQVVGDAVFGSPLERLNEKLNAARELIASIRAKQSQYPDNVIEHCDRVFYAAAQIFLLLRQKPSRSRRATAHLIECGVKFGDELQSLLVVLNLQRPMQGAICTAEAGRAGAVKRHAAARPRIDVRDDKMERRASLLNSIGKTRDEVLRDLSQQFGVKTSTLSKNPRIRKHLPAARRKRSP